MSQPWALGNLLSPHAGGRGRDPKRHPVHLRRQPSPGAEETSFLLVGGAFQKRKQKPSWDHEHLITQVMLQPLLPLPVETMWKTHVRKRAHEGKAEGEEETESPADCPAELRARCGARSHDPEITAYAETKSRTLSRLSHPGAPCFSSITKGQFYQRFKVTVSHIKVKRDHMCKVLGEGPRQPGVLQASFSPSSSKSVDTTTTTR
ncbi:uncharacterized protein LOC125753653 isoform X1 [Canis lupus dingo]|uniref:uncharacterized protein LOC125753653 isoform X1 n=1 Tax=Canis lupus dingo TaxID=286419 RepID=UPI0020C3EDCE|nr:uncharacterized protein LOC125753653 isoform X1 [Canis lupus dingo]